MLSGGVTIPMKKLLLSLLVLGAVIATAAPIQADEDRGDHTGMMDIGTTTTTAIGTDTEAIGRTTITSIHLSKPDQ
jgi:hypothetical protein